MENDQALVAVHRMKQTLASAEVLRFASSVGPVIEAWKRALAAIKALCDIKIPGLVLVRMRAAREFEEWGASEDFARWLAWKLPYRYCVGFVRMVRH